MADNDHLNCSICYETFRGACVASCGHSFCTHCLLSYWESSNANEPVKCPLDRSPVSYMAPNFSLREQCTRVAGASQPSAEEQKALDARIVAYNARFSNLPRGIGQEIREDVAIYRNLPNSSLQKWVINILIGFTFLYLLFPVDLIPDTLGFVGYLDDLFAIIVILIIIAAMLGAVRSSIIQNANRH